MQKKDIEQNAYLREEEKAEVCMQRQSREHRNLKKMRAGRH
jgi:hypothetical protein